MSKRKFVGDRPSIDEIRALRKPRTKTVWVPLDADLLAEIDELERSVKVAVREDDLHNREPLAPAMQQQLDALRSDAERAAVAFEFTELPRKQWRQLIADHPPEDPKTMRWDEETFAPAAIAACCTSPAMTVEQAREIWDEWGSTVAYLLAGAAVAVNESESKIPFSVTSIGAANGSRLSSTTAPNEE